jgi:hypothetical protein
MSETLLKLVYTVLGIWLLNRMLTRSSQRVCRAVQKIEVAIVPVEMALEELLEDEQI